MPKRKTAREAAGGRAPGVRAAKMQLPSIPEIKKLSYEERKFVEAYCENGGNGTRAYLCGWPDAAVSTAGTESYRLLKNPQIQTAIEETRARWADAVNFKREKYFRIRVAQATATLDEFTEVMRNPYDKEAYARLGDLKFALEYAQEGKNGNSIQLVNKEPALNELATVFGFNKPNDSRDWSPDEGSILSRVARFRDIWNKK